MGGLADRAIMGQGSGVVMKFLRSAAPFLLLPLCITLAAAGDQNDKSLSQAPKISKQTQIELIHLLNAELVYARSPFPMGTQGLKLRDGVVTPSGPELQASMAVDGPAVKVGDPARISDVKFHDNFVRVEINGGPIRKQKWYQHISIGGADGQNAPIAPSDPQANARGSFVDVYFDHYVPEMTGEQFKTVLTPVLDFHAKSREEAYLDTVPPKVRQAIQEHKILVGMDHEMVMFAKGRPPRKVRERDGEVEYEEWIYGTPPEDVDFVRFNGDEVVRLEIMKVDGTKLVRTDKEVDVETNTKVAKDETTSKPALAPTLRRPGEEPDNADPRKDVGAMPLPPNPGPDPSSGPGSAPNVL
jgi:hypothetical protein